MSKQTKVQKWKLFGLFIGIIFLLGLGWCVNTSFFQNGIVYHAFRQIVPLERIDGWRKDIDFLDDRMRSLHPNLFHSMSEEEFQHAVNKLKSTIKDLNDDEVIVEIMRLVALTSYKGGRDGHMYVPLFQEATNFRILPLQLYKFSDGWFVIEAQEPYQELIGRQLVAIEGVDIETVHKKIAPLVSRDNASTVKARIGEFFLCPELLHALGLAPVTDSATLSTKNSSNERSLTEVRPIAWEKYQKWQEADNERENFKFDYLEDSQTVHIQYNAVRSKTNSGESMREFSKRVEAFIAENVVARIIVDLRNNGGGNNYTYGPLLNLLSENEAVNQLGTLFVITGRDTFSAAGNFATDVERATSAVFVGEPMGGGVNQYGDSISVVLPNSGLEVRIASKYWQIGEADDKRLTIMPDVLVERSSAEFFADDDPAMDAVLGYR